MNFSSSISRSSNKEATLKKMIKGAYLKILLNYSQTITILTSLHLNWNYILLDFFNIHKVISGDVDQVINFECLVKGIF